MSKLPNDRAINISDFAQKDTRPIDPAVPQSLNANDVLNLRESDFNSADSPLVKEAKANARPSFQEMVKSTSFYKTSSNVSPPENLDEEMVKTGDISEVPEDYQSSLDPITAEVVKSHQGNLNDIRLGSYQKNGELFVYVDAKSYDRAASYDVKQAAYEYRFNINMPNSGIEEYGSPYLTDINERPISKFFEEKYTGPIYRKVFKLRATLR